MAQQLPGSTRHDKKRRLENDISTDNVSQNNDSWARFLVIEAADHQPLKLNPFAISKAVSGICGVVKNVTRLRSGSLLVECARRQQSLNLLSITQFANVDVAVSVHRTLNSCRGIVRDRARCLSDMSEQEIVSELEDQGVTFVKRFTRINDGVVTNTHTYLFTFARSSLPQSIKAGYVNIGVDMYIPNPLRCFKCQTFGHGSKSCAKPVKCHRCAGSHEGNDCEEDIVCANCGGQHFSSSKSCPVWQLESKINKMKYENNISFADARKLFTKQSTTPSHLTYSAARSATISTATASITSQTDLSWVHSDQPLQTAEISPPTSDNQTSSATQTSTQTASQTDTVVPEKNKSTEPLDSSLAKKKKKKLNRKQSSQAASPPELSLQNSFEPLDMEVTLSVQDSRSNSSSRSRVRTPIEPP
ncbi:uncharacterized protein LOC125373270 [Haliotis rufescens]|uniref:uncharacterized protein LOC125373270 n=1 Tax=Haliotis rufescens TaxID=6454 RepID=UPI00201F338E|nr:uncharacterized protein LOC125373270 [Haliotis rufescens]